MSKVGTLPEADAFVRSFTDRDYRVFEIERELETDQLGFRRFIKPPKDT